MFNLLHEMKRWLQQHVFKVGWLFTKDLHITTILFYTFFLPGVVLYEIVYWLAAGVLNVRAEHAITMPEKQDIGELQLNFIKLSKKASPAKVAIINLSPLFAGLVIIWFIASQVFNIESVLAILSSGNGSLESVQQAITQLTSASDFWLWAFLVFTIGNTMLPDPKALRGWWWLVGIAALATAPLFMLGVGEEIVGGALAGPFATALNLLSVTFGLIILFDLVGVLILGAIEATIERITGRSATFKNGKMIVMTRAEVIAARKQAREKAYAARKKQLAASQPESIRGPASIYALSLPIPGPPGREPVTNLATIATMGDRPELPKAPQRPPREEPNVIVAEKSTALPDVNSNSPQTDEGGRKISHPVFNPMRPSTPPAFRQNDDNDEDKDDGDDEQFMTPAAARFNRPIARQFSSSQEEDGGKADSEAEKPAVPRFARPVTTTASPLKQPAKSRIDRTTAKSADGDTGGEENADADARPAVPRFVHPASAASNRSIPGSSSRFTRPVPKPSSEVSLPGADAQENKDSDNDDEEQETNTLPPLRPRPTSFSNLDRSALRSRLGRITPVPKPDDDDEDEDEAAAPNPDSGDDEISYEDIEDPA